jgi:hypothetical protein
MVYDKILYMHGSVIDPVWEPQGPDGTGFEVQGSSEPACCRVSPDTGWNTWNSKGTMQGNGYRLSDGSWHCYEVHFKTNTTTNPYNGVYQFWHDGLLKANFTNVDYMKDAIDWILVGSNQSSPANGGCRYLDLDDIAIGNAGYIGPAGEGPKPPTGLRIIQ